MKMRGIGINVLRTDTLEYYREIIVAMSWCCEDIKIDTLNQILFAFHSQFDLFIIRIFPIFLSSHTSIIQNTWCRCGIRNKKKKPTTAIFARRAIHRTITHLWKPSNLISIAEQSPKNSVATQIFRTQMNFSLIETKKKNTCVATEKTRINSIKQLKTALFLFCPSTTKLMAKLSGGYETVTKYI